MLEHQRVGCTWSSEKCGRSTDGTDKPPVGGLQSGYNHPCCLEKIKAICWFIADLFDREGILYWMDFGTLLGAVRNGELIPWDKDADFGVLLKDEPKIDKLYGKIRRAGFDIDKPWNGLYKVYYSKHNRNYIDLFTWDKWSLNQKRKDWWKRECMHNMIGLNHKKFFPSWFIEETEWVELHGKPLRAPREYEKFLELRFGKSWKIPSRKWDNANRIPMHEIQGWCEARGWRVPKNDKPALKMG
jgi:hypothetical protein